MSEEAQFIVGTIEGFTTEPFLRAAEILWRADEPERALKLLQLVPAFYRDHIPNELLKLRTEILEALCTPNAYADVDMDCPVTPPDEAVKWMRDLSRGVMAEKAVQELSQAGAPHIIEMGPGEYWLPVALSKLGYDFTYHDVSLLKRGGRAAREIVDARYWQEKPKPSQKILFVAFELIEHLPDTKELVIEALRHGTRMPDVVLLSTPLYTYDGRIEKEWRGPLGMRHLRAYTPQEFLTEASTLFPGYNWEADVQQIMTLKGTKL